MGYPFMLVLLLLFIFARKKGNFEFGLILS